LARIIRIVFGSVAGVMLVAALAKMKREGGLGVVALQQHLGGVDPGKARLNS
jgi:hypothetical protein